MKFEYPWPCYVNKDPDFFNDITMFDLSFDTKFHYSKNHSSGYATLLIKILGFGIRLEYYE